MGRIAHLLALCALALPSCAVAGEAQKCALEQWAKFDISIDGRHSIVTGKLNGTEFPIVIDSGASISVISAAATKQLGLTGRPTNLNLQGVGGVSYGVNVVRVKDTLVSRVRAPNMFYVVNERDGLPGGADVLIGQNFLRAADIEYDLANGALKVFAPSACANSSHAYWSSTGASVVPLKSLEANNNLLRVNVVVNGVTLEAVLDTGAGSSTLSPQGARRLGLEQGDPEVVSTAASVGGFGARRRQVSLVTLKSFTIGDETITNTRLAMNELPGIDLLLGADFFLSHRIYVAHKMRKIYFTYNGGPVFRTGAAPKTASPPSTTPEAAKAAELQAEEYSRRASASMSRGASQDALADLDKAVALEPTVARYYYERSRAQNRTGKGAAALADLNKAIDLKADYGEALLDRARVHFANKRQDDAVKDLEAAVKASPSDDDVQLGAASVYVVMDRFDPGIRLFDDWLTKNPRHARTAATLNSRCWARALSNTQLDLALADCNRAIGTAGKLPAYLDSRGLTYLRMGRYDLALQDFDAVLRAAPGMTGTLHFRGVTRVKKDMKTEGEADIARAKAISPGAVAFSERYGIKP